MSQTDTPSQRLWEALDPEEQTALLEAYGYWLDRLPPTCSLQAKEARFQAWLREQGVFYEPKP
jgi:TRAP-type C4-dicarboxylate transport system substrate-binding protein